MSNSCSECIFSSQEICHVVKRLQEAKNKITDWKKWPSAQLRRRINVKPLNTKKYVQAQTGSFYRSLRIIFSFVFFFCPDGCLSVEYKSAKFKSCDFTAVAQTKVTAWHRQNKLLIFWSAYPRIRLPLKPWKVTMMTLTDQNG